jgi:hypothetical protein
LNHAVNCYRRAAFNFPAIVQPFIGYQDVGSLQQLLEKTEGVISGSTALQYLDRVRFKTSDLDIYISAQRCAEASDWLLEHGMKKKANSDDKIGHGTDSTIGYTGITEVDHIEEFEVSISGRTVQLIATKHHPVLAILRFHSCTHSLFVR